MQLAPLLGRGFHGVSVLARMDGLGLWFGGALLGHGGVNGDRLGRPALPDKDLAQFLSMFNLFTFKGGKIIEKRAYYNNIMDQLTAGSAA